MKRLKSGASGRESQKSLARNFVEKDNANYGDCENLNATQKEPVLPEDIFEVTYSFTNYQNSKGHPHSYQVELMKSEALIELIKAGKMCSAVNKGAYNNL